MRRTSPKLKDKTAPVGLAIPADIWPAAPTLPFSSLPADGPAALEGLTKLLAANRPPAVENPTAATFGGSPLSLGVAPDPSALASAIDWLSERPASQASADDTSPVQTGDGAAGPKYGGASPISYASGVSGGGYPPVRLRAAAIGQQRPLLLAAADEDEPPADFQPGLSPAQIILNHSYYSAASQLRSLEPNNPVANRTFLGAGPTEQDYQEVKDELAGAQLRARGIAPGPITVPQPPDWRTSERMTDEQLGPGFLRQPSFLRGKLVPYGTPGSKRPDNYRFNDDGGDSIDTKNYAIDTPAGRWRLAYDAAKQASDRADHLPPNSSQWFVVELHGRQISQELREQIGNDIEGQSFGLVPGDQIIFRK